MAHIGLISEPEYKVFDGVGISNCESVNRIQWSAGTYLIGAVYMWNITKDPKWRERIEEWMRGVSVFLAQPGKILYQAVVSRQLHCNVDQRSFSTGGAFLYAAAHEALATSAEAAALTCRGGDDRLQCGHSWLPSSFDGDLGLGNQMSALEVIQSLLAKPNNVPVTNSTGGTSKGDPVAGSSGNRSPVSPVRARTTAADD